MTYCGIKYGGIIFLAFLGCLFLEPFLLSAQSLPYPEELTLAVQQEDLFRIDSLIAQGVNLDSPNAQGLGPLDLALIAGRSDILYRLLKNGAQANRISADGLTALMRAVLLSRDDFVALLLQANADPQVISDFSPKAAQEGGAIALGPYPISALSLALDRGEYAIARRLVAADTRIILLEDSVPQKVNPLGIPSPAVSLDARLWNNWADLAFRSDSPDWTEENEMWALHRAARGNDWQSARRLLNTGTSPDFSDKQGISPLMVAAWWGSDAVISLLLQWGADPNRRDTGARNALAYAAAAGKIKASSNLLRAQSSPDAPEAGRLEDSALYYSLIGAHYVILDHLLLAGAQTDSRDEEGLSALMIASWLGQSYAVEKLLPRTLSIWGETWRPAYQDKAGRTALAWAVAAFNRDREIGREIGNFYRAARYYPLIRMLARRGKNPESIRLQPTRDLPIAVQKAWSLDSGPPHEDWKNNIPAILPRQSGDGDSLLYRLLRDEEVEG